MLPARRATQALTLALTLVAGACAEPPNKEMHQAQGAIEAARAAGAERYAATELDAAVKALAQADAAATQRDYRLALNHALDSRERAQSAAREAATGRAAARSRAERLLAEVTTALATATGRLEAAEHAKLPSEALAGPRDQITAVQKAVQEAGTALGREDYLGAAQVLEGRADAVRAAIASVDAALAAPAPTSNTPAAISAGTRCRQQAYDRWQSLPAWQPWVYADCLVYVGRGLQSRPDPPALKCRLHTRGNGIRSPTAPACRRSPAARRRAPTARTAAARRA